MKDMETIRIILRRQYMHLTAKRRQKSLKNLDFTILSNNCWGGFIYQSYNLPYKTPTIGLYFMAEDYILFLENLDECLESNIQFINSKNSKYYEILKNTYNFGNYPIGIINLKKDTIEIHFLHYKDENEAINKWNERKKRINKGKLIVKFSDQNNCNKELIKRFEKLPYKHKVFFGAKKYTKNTIHINVPSQFDFVPTSYEPFGSSRKLNINQMINRL